MQHIGDEISGESNENENGGHSRHEKKKRGTLSEKNQGARMKFFDQNF